MEALASDQTPGRKAALTGSARKLKDNAADWHNLILKWDKLNDQGSTIASKIVNLGLSTESQMESGHMVLEDGGRPISPGAGRSAGPSRELEEECGRLGAVVDSMSRVVCKMERLLSSQRGVLDLELFQCGSSGRPTPLFHTWPTARFVEVSSALLESYAEELRLKKAVLQDLAHTRCRHLSMLHLSCWLHQPYLDHSLRLLLESLLLETGHRPS